MLKKYSKFLDILEMIEKAVLAVTVGAMVVIMIYQIILRYIFSASNAWAEELVGYLFVLDVMLAAAIAIRRNSHLQIDILINLFPEKVKKVFTIIATVVGIVFLCFLFRYSLTLVSTATRNTSAGLHITMAIPYSALPLGAVLMILTSIETILKNIAELREGKETSV